MNPIYIVDLVSFIAVSAGMIVLLSGWNRRFERDTKLSFLVFLALTAFHDFSNLLEWSGITSSLDAYEDFVGVLQPLMLGLFFYTILREFTNRDLRESEKRLRTILDAVETAVVIIDTETRTIVDVNRVATELIDLPKSDIIGKQCQQLICTSENGKCPITDLDNCIKRSEGTIKNAQGRHIPTIKTVTTTVLNGRKHLLATYMDVTALRQVEEEKEILEAQLIQAQKMQALGTLAGGIAHDFNNILFPVMGFTEMAIDEVPKGSTAHRNMEEVFKATQRASALVKQILAFSRQADQERKPLKVQPIIEEALTLLTATLPTTIEVKQHMDKDCHAIIADATQVHQMVMNLSTNAYHAMKETGGVLEVTLSSMEIARDDVITNLNLEPGAYVKLTFSDTGCGIDKDVLSRIFEPYFTTKGPGEGTGLGLSVAHGIVTGYGGDITVYSEPGQGTVFNVYLPTVEPHVEEKETAPADIIPTGKESILLVDDEEQIVRMVRLMLERLGYRVTGRTSSVEALEAFCSRPAAYDLVITDQTMPNMTGVELSRELLKVKPKVPVILCTGFSETVTERKAKAVGIKEYVMKPVVRKEIATTIRKVLDQYQEE